jgi:hypothetical protein
MSSVHKSRTRNESEFLFCCKQVKVDFGGHVKDAESLET